MFRRTVNHYSHSLGALRDFVEIVNPVLMFGDGDLEREYGQDVLPIALIVKLLRGGSGMDDLADDVQEYLDKRLGGRVRISSFDDPDSGRGVSFGFIPDNPVAASEFVYVRQKVSQFFRRVRHPHLLRASALISLVSSSEWFFSRILKKYVQRYPSLADDSEKRFSLDDLASFASVEEARNMLIDEKITGVVRQRFDHWIKFLESKSHLSVDYLQVDQRGARVTEVFQRRNIVVHNGGIVNTTYMSNVDAAIRDPSLRIGGKVTVSHDYIGKSLDLFEICFVLMAAELWKKISPEDEHRGSLLISLAFDHLCLERWPIAEAFSLFGMRDSKLPDVMKTSAQLNYWQSVKWQGRFREIEDEVCRADFSAKDDCMKLCRLALMDRPDQFFELLPTVVTGNDRLDDGLGHRLNYSDLHKWPIFREMRSHPKYPEFVENHRWEYERFRLVPQAQVPALSSGEVACSRPESDDEEPKSQGASNEPS